MRGITIYKLISDIISIQCETWVFSKIIGRVAWIDR